MFPTELLWPNGMVDISSSDTDEKSPELPDMFRRQRHEEIVFGFDWEIRCCAERVRARDHWYWLLELLFTISWHLSGWGVAAKLHGWAFCRTISMTIFPNTWISFADKGWGKISPDSPMLSGKYLRKMSLDSLEEWGVEMEDVELAVASIDFLNWFSIISWHFSDRGVAIKYHGWALRTIPMRIFPNS